MIPAINIAPLLLVMLSWLLPLLSFAFLFLLGEKIAEHKRGVIATGVVFVSLCAALGALLQLGLGSEQEYSIPWFSYASGEGNQQFTFSVLLNGISLLMLNVALFISLLVHWYSIEYMHHKKNHAVYYPYLGLFTASMVLLVISNNILLTFMAWELVGFSSYLLVGFWFDKEAAAKAASKAFLMNRIADVFFLGALLILFVHVGSFDITFIKAAYAQALIPADINFWIGFLFFVGCMAKTAQFPLNSWLPDAMEGPTPVSALLHAATMVAAGVFLLVKLEYLLNEEVRLIMAVVGSFTAFFGALPALTTFDSKKILAFSTVSQLGYMIAAIGCSAPGAAYFHLITHAFFKAGLFLSVGVVIHALHEVQVKAAKENRFLVFNTMDIRFMGGMSKRLPLALFAYLVTAASLIGLPFFSGFLSKESMLNAMFSMALTHEGVFWIVPLLCIATVFITAYYVTRQGLWIFFGESRLLALKDFTEEIWTKVNVRKSALYIPLVLLSAASFFIAFSWNPFSAHHSWIYALSGLPLQAMPEYFMVMIISLVLVSTGVGMAYYINRNSSVSDRESFLSRLWSHFYYLDAFATACIVSPLQKGSVLMAKVDRQGIDGAVHLFVYAIVLKAHVIAWFDKTIVDGVISSAVYLTGKVGKVFRVFQKGNVQNYLFWVLVVFLALAAWTMMRVYR